MLMMMTMANGIAAAPARPPAQPTQMDIAQFSMGAHEQCDRDEKSSISKVALRIEDGTWKERASERVGEKEAVLPPPPLITRHPFKLQCAGSVVGL